MSRGKKFRIKLGGCGLGRGGSEFSIILRMSSMYDPCFGKSSILEV